MTLKERYSGIQSILEDCHKSGCHFLTLLSIAEEDSGKEIDLINAIRLCMSKGWMQSNFAVRDGCAILNHYTNRRWYRKVVTELPDIIKDNEYTECHYFNERTRLEHFRRRSFDTLIDSVTVREGYIKEYYIWYY